MSNLILGIKRNFFFGLISKTTQNKYLHIVCQLFTQKNCAAFHTSFIQINSAFSLFCEKAWTFHSIMNGNKRHDAKLLVWKVSINISHEFYLIKLLSKTQPLVAWKRKFMFLKVSVTWSSYGYKVQRTSREANILCFRL